MLFNFNYYYFTSLTNNVWSSWTSMKINDILWKIDDHQSYPGENFFISTVGFYEEPIKPETGILDKGLSEYLILDLDNKTDPGLAFDEAEMLLEHYPNGGMVNSGKKGVHVYLPITPQYIDKEVLKEVYIILKNRHNLEYIDENVINNPKRMIRAPMGYRWDTDMLVDILQDPGKPIPKLDKLITNTCEYVQEKNILTERVRENKTKWRLLINKQRGYDDNEKINWNVMHHIYPLVHGETGENTSKGRYIVNCPYHNDRNPSAVYNESGFQCSSCGKKLGVYDMLIEAGYTPREAINIIKQYGE